MAGIGAAPPGEVDRRRRRDRRLPASLLAAAAAFALGVGGLVLGEAGAAVPAASPAGATGQPAVTQGDITIRGAYLREPAAADTAAAYLSVTNAGSQPDTLRDIYSGAARSTVLHDVPPAGATAASPTTTTTGGVPGAGAGGSGSAASGPANGPTAATNVPSGPLTIPPGTTITLSPGRGHIMLAGLTGPLRAGDTVSLLLTFDRAGEVLVEAPVIPITAPAPGGSS